MKGLTPFETLPGWPAAPDPTAIESLTVLIGIPAAIAAVVLLLIMAPTWFSRGGDQVAVRQQD